jgi:hypothetical protein
MECNKSARFPLSEPVGIGLYDCAMSIGHKIKERRDELARLDPIRYSVEETARAAGMKPPTLYGLERGDQQNSTRLPWLCDYLGLNIRWVTDGIGPRLVAGSTKGVQLVETDQTPSGGAEDDMAGVMREVMEVGLLLTSMPIHERVPIIQMIRSMAARSSQPELKKETETQPASHVPRKPAHQ